MLETPPDVSQIEGSPRDGAEPLREPLSNLAVELTRVSAELQSINAGFQGHLHQALGEMQRAMEAEFQARLERAIQATREQVEAKLQTEFQSQLSQELQATRDDLTKRLESEFRVRLERETQVARELATAGLNAEFETRLAQELQATRDEVADELRKEYQIRLDREMQVTRERLIPRVTDVQKEMARVASQLQAVSSEIAEMIDDPNAALSKVMRKKAEESVLRSYLDGLKFTAGEPTG